jgi:hypothetical protein
MSWKQNTMRGIRSNKSINKPIGGGPKKSGLAASFLGGAGVGLLSGRTYTGGPRRVQANYRNKNLIVKNQNLITKNKLTSSEEKPDSSKDVNYIPKEPFSPYKTEPFVLLNGNSSKNKTYATLSYNDFGLIVNFVSSPTLNTIGENPMLKCNADLWEQEVCEIFIRPSNSDPEKYLEVEINPFGYLWVGMDTNKGCNRSGEDSLINKMIDCKESNIQSYSKLDTTNNLWSSQLIIPWKFLHYQFNIKGNIHPSQNAKMRKWMINMFCVRMNKHSKKCDTIHDCEFTALFPTKQYNPPNFHSCSAFEEFELRI